MAGDEVWIPTVSGLAVWDLRFPTAEPAGPTRLLPWPAGSLGGTPFPLPGGRIATISRGDVEMGTESVFEIFAAAEEDED